MKSVLVEAPLVQVQLRGHLATELTGELLSLRAWSAAAAIRLIRCNYPMFDEIVYKAQERGVAYLVSCGDRILEKIEDLQDPIAAKILTISPMLAGSGGFGKALLGAALIVGSIYTGGTLSAVLLSTGVSFAATGIAQVISPQPTTPKTEEDRKRSALFDSAAGEASDGDAVFLHYGKGWVSGKVLSQSITTEDI